VLKKKYILDKKRKNIFL